MLNDLEQVADDQLERIVGGLWEDPAPLQSTQGWDEEGFIDEKDKWSGMYFGPSMELGE